MRFLPAMFFVACFGFSAAVRGDGVSDLNACYEAGARGDYDTAIALCSRALDSGDLSNEWIAVALNNRGNAYNKTRDYDRAIQDFDQSIRLKPDLPQAYNGRGHAYGFKGEFDRSIQDYDQSIRREPDQTNVYLTRGRAFFVLARFAEAGEDLSRYVKSNPRNAHGVLWLFLAQARDHKSGEQQLNANARSLDLVKWPSPIVRYYQQQISVEETLKAAADPDPRIAMEQECETAFFIGQIELIAGRTEPAKARFQRALDICPKSFIEFLAAKAELSRL